MTSANHPSSGKHSPLVSIIVPVYNGERFLRESLDSILAQTYPRIEVLVMDDASSDSTPSIIASYGERVRRHRQLQNRGIYGNANDGMAVARGEYIAVYHADDVYLPGIVEKQVAFLERYPEAGAAFCPAIFMDAAGQERGKMELPPEVRGERPLAYPVILNALLKYKNIFLTCPSAMVRASVYRELGGFRDQEFRNTSDMEMWLRIGRKYPLGILEDHLFRYRFGHGNSSQRYHHLRTDPGRYFRIMDLYLEQGDSALASPEALAAHEAHRAEDCLMRAINCYILGSREEARSILSQVRAQRILGSSAVERGRLLALLLGMRGLVRLPRIPLLADVFYRRWNARRGIRRRPFAALRSGLDDAFRKIHSGAQG